MSEDKFDSGRMLQTGTGIFGTLWQAMRMAKKSSRDIAGTDLVLVESLRRLARMQSDATSADRRVRAATKAGLPALVDEIADGAAVELPDDAWMVEAAGALREAAWAELSRDTGGEFYHAVEARPRWSTAVLTAVYSAMREAAANGQPRAAVTHLLIALLLDPGNRASELLRMSNVYPDELLRATRQTKAARRGSRPWTPSLDLLRSLGLVAGRSRVIRLATAYVRWRATRGMDAGPEMVVLRREADRQAVRLGHDRVLPAHLMVAVAAVDYQLQARGATLRDDLAPHSQGGRILREQNAGYRRLIPEAARPGLNGFELADRPLERRSRRARPPWAAASVAVLEHASRIAREGDPGREGTEHLLLALLDGGYPDVLKVLDGLGVDPLRIRSAVEEQLAHNGRPRP